MRLGFALNLPGAALIPRAPRAGGAEAPPAPTPTPTPSPALPAPIGFYRNGSANPIWSAAVTSIRAGNATRYAAMLIGDSTGAGRGGGDGNTEWTNAYAGRPARWIADRLTSAGVTASQQSFHGDGGSGNIALFNPAVAPGGWISNSWGLLAGGSYFTPGGAPLTFTTTGANRWRVNFLNEGGGGATPTLLIDGRTPTFTSGPAVTGGGGGFTDMIVGVAGTGPHTLSVGGSGLFLNGITAFADTGGVDIVSNAVSGATTDTRASVAGNYASKSFIGQVAPAVTIINLGLNDMYTGVSPTDYIARLQSIAAAAKAVGDVLIMFPQPAGGAFNANVATFHAATKQLAADSGVAFFSLYEFDGGVFTPANMQDNVVHPTAATYRRYHDATAVALLKMAGM